MTDEAWDDDDVPGPSPEIRQDYQAALGRFILAFNELDYLLQKSSKSHWNVLTGRSRQGLRTTELCAQIADP